MFLSFHESPDKSQISYFLLCNYIDLFIPVAIPKSDRLFNHAQPECSTWHKFPNPGGAISTKNVIFPIQGAQFWLKMSYFQTRGQDFDQICPIYNPGGTILTLSVLMATPVAILLYI